MNSLYGPPKDMPELERIVIAQALGMKIAAEAAQMRQSLDDYCNQGMSMKEYQNRYSHNVNILRQLYRVVCRYVESPLPFSFYENIVSRPPEKAA